MLWLEERGTSADARGARLRRVALLASSDAEIGSDDPDVKLHARTPARADWDCTRPRLGAIAERALDKLRLCSTDPICVDHDPDAYADDRALSGTASG